MFLSISLEKLFSKKCLTNKYVFFLLFEKRRCVISSIHLIQFPSVFERASISILIYNGIDGFKKPIGLQVGGISWWSTNGLISCGGWYKYKLKEFPPPLLASLWMINSTSLIVEPAVCLAETRFQVILCSSPT